MVRMRGLEPPRLTALAPKTSVSTIPPHPLVSEENATGVILPNSPIKDQLSISIILEVYAFEFIRRS
jgi:hypothetical protein